jgi:hypothetical protein
MHAQQHHQLILYMYTLRILTTVNTRACCLCCYLQYYEMFNKEAGGQEGAGF